LVPALPSALIGGEALFDGVSIAAIVVVVAYLREAVDASCGGVRDGGRNIYGSWNEMVVGGLSWTMALYRPRCC
jgi:hypothetical protein